MKKVWNFWKRKLAFLMACCIVIGGFTELPTPHLAAAVLEGTGSVSGNDMTESVSGNDVAGSVSGNDIAGSVSGNDVTQGSENAGNM